LNPELGHRVIEIAAIELNGRKVSQQHFHHYLDPEREVDEDASKVHGFTWEMLKGRSKFNEIAPALLDFIAGAELIIHNAPFDMGFLNAELQKVGLPKLENSVIDTLKLAKELHPGKKNNLNALCDRYQIDNSHRTLHGALLDTELLAEVYLAMTRGQESLLGNDSSSSNEDNLVTDRIHLNVNVITASKEELSLHELQLVEIDKASKGACLWKQLEVRK
jgi:DNA polymerase-3 subunit epsilon